MNGEDNTSLHDSIDSKKMVRCLCASQVYHQMHYFLTFTCNQSKHFGTKMIKNWTDGIEWQDNFKDFYKYEVEEQNEVHRQLKEASGPLMLRNWMETRKFLIDYLKGSPSSPYFQHMLYL